MSEKKKLIKDSPAAFNLNFAGTQTDRDRNFQESIGSHFVESSGTVLDKLNNFSRFVPRQIMSLFLAKYEIFRQIIEIHGNIVECGVFLGGGLFTWAQLSAIYEPYNHGRKIIGFDTFSGFPKISDRDAACGTENVEHKHIGGYAFDGMQELQQSAELYDLNRPIGHIPKIEFVAGDAVQTIPRYIEENKHLVVSLLYLDFDLYEPTRAALDCFLPRMPKGALIAFDELNQKQWPGETQAVLDGLGLNNVRIKRFSHTPSLSYCVLE